MKKILVANRGEIALRIMRTIRKMGLQSVAVFSDADRGALHVRYADEAIYLGGSPSSESYLRGDKIIALAKTLGVDGIHPGYGFLSENADFAQEVQDAGMIFIGPPPGAMRVMGNKLSAKACVKAYNIPMVPGIDEAIEDIKVAKTIAGKIGYPVLIKAAAGGGGKGMRIVEEEKDMESQMERAVSEARSSFGDGAVFIEKYVRSPRHVEIQVLADHFGNTVHLFERECSIQRRHQKVIEESPSVILTPEKRQQMGEAAVLVAKSCNYTSTGTVEFLMDDQVNFYFLEMNTRLQVEHPVTEMITGLDLVEEQINIANGMPLRFTQEAIPMVGHAIELRVYAEDPLDDFMPSTGKLEQYEKPVAEGVRVDDGFEEGMDIPVYYDPLIAKLVTYGSDRTAAIRKMKDAIKQYKIKGVSTTLSFGTFVLNHDAFVSGNFDTHFVKDFYSKENIQAMQESKAKIAALAALQFYLDEQKKTRPVENKSTSWKRRLA